MDDKTRELIRMFQKTLAMPPNENFNPNSLDACIARIQEKLDQILEMQKNIMPRINALEKFKWYLMGAVGVVSMVFNVAWEWLKAHAK
jgi:hypothetical protein